MCAPSASTRQNSAAGGHGPVTNALRTTATDRPQCHENITKCHVDLTFDHPGGDLARAPGGRPDRPQGPGDHRRGRPPHARRVQHRADAHGDRHRELVPHARDARLVAGDGVLAGPRGQPAAGVGHRYPQSRKRGLELLSPRRPHDQDSAIDDARRVDGLPLHQRRPGEGEPDHRGLRHRDLLRGGPRWRRGGSSR